MEKIITSTPIPDSIHMIKISDEELAKIIKMDDYKLGYYKRESEAIRGIYIRQRISDVVL